jgi:hypothetical protein
MAGTWTTLLDRAALFVVTHTVWNSLFGGTGNLSLVRRTYARDVSEQEVVNTGSETTVFTETIPGNNVGPDAQIRLTLWGDFLNSSGGNSTCTIRVKYGGTTIFTYAESLASDANRRNFKLKVDICYLNATNAQRAFCEAQMSAPAANGSTAAVSNQGISRDTTLTKDTTTSQTLLVSVHHDGGTSTRSFFMRFARFEIIP